MKTKNLDNAKITKYGKCFLMEFPEDVNRPQILHLQGDPFEMGKAHGYLLAEKIKEFYSLYFSPIAAMFGGWVPGSGTPSIEQMNIGKNGAIF